MDKSNAGGDATEDGKSGILMSVHSLSFILWAKGGGGVLHSKSLVRCLEGGATPLVPGTSGERTLMQV